MTEKQLAKMAELKAQLKIIADKILFCKATRQTHLPYEKEFRKVEREYKRLWTIKYNETHNLPIIY